MKSRNRSHFSLFASLLIHTLIIFGLGFTAVTHLYEPPQPLILQLTISEATEETPEDALFLAQHDHTGSGTQAENDRGRKASPITLIRPRSGSDPDDAESSRFQPASLEPVLVAILQGEDDPVHRSSETPAVTNTDKLRYSRALELISRYAGEVDQLDQRSSDLSRHKFVSSSTRESHYAAYIEAWRQRVEKVGNLNYPEIARQQNLSGELILAVAISHDGLVRSIRVTRSSGIKVLDDAAVHITVLAAPFEPLPEAIRRETDVLNISRTWQFLDNARLISH